MATATLKVFDFDVARILPKDSVCSPSTLYHLTRNVGSPRYMSPECARGDDYNYKADVYTMGLLCFEFLTLQKPYHDVTGYDHAECVFYNGLRPQLPEVILSPTTIIAAASAATTTSSSLSKSKKVPFIPSPAAKQQLQQQQPLAQFWTSSLQRLVQRMWNEDIAQRPTMKEARIELESHAADIQCQLNDIQSRLEQYQQQQLVNYNNPTTTTMMQSLHQQHSSSLQDVDCSCNLKEVDGLLSKSTLTTPTTSTTTSLPSFHRNNNSRSSSKRPFSLRLWKPIAKNESNNVLNGSQRQNQYNIGNRGRCNSSSSSLLGTTRHTTWTTTATTTTTGLSCNFASFHNLAVLNQQEQQEPVEQ
jgi:Protein kinase domain